MLPEQKGSRPAEASQRAWSTRSRTRPKPSDGHHQRPVVGNIECAPPRLGRRFPSTPRCGYDHSSQWRYSRDDKARALSACSPHGRLSRLTCGGRALANLLRRLVVDPPSHLRAEQSHRFPRSRSRDRRRIPGSDHQPDARRDPAAACRPRSGAMAVDDAVLLQPSADLHRLVISSPAVPALALALRRAAIPQAQAEDRRAAAAAAAARAATSR